MEHDVHVVGRPNNADPTPHAVKLRHQPADEGPLRVGDNACYLSNIGPGLALHRQRESEASGPRSVGRLPMQGSIGLLLRPNAESTSTQAVIGLLSTATTDSAVEAA